MAAYAAYPIIDRYMIAPYAGGADGDGEAEDSMETTDTAPSSAD